MDNKLLNDSELEQVTGGKSYEEWKAYFDSIRSIPTSERRQLIIKSRNGISNDPDLSEYDKTRLRKKMDAMWGMEK